MGRQNQFAPRESPRPVSRGYIPAVLALKTKELGFPDLDGELIPPTGRLKLKFFVRQNKIDCATVTAKNPSISKQKDPISRINQLFYSGSQWERNELRVHMNPRIRAAYGSQLQDLGCNHRFLMYRRICLKHDVKQIRRAGSRELCSACRGYFPGFGSR